MRLSDITVTPATPLWGGECNCNTTRYTPSSVMEYVNKQTCSGVDMDIIEGCLIDTYILYQKDCVEIFREVPVNSWESAYVYAKEPEVPQYLLDELEKQEAEDMA